MDSSPIIYSISAADAGRSVLELAQGLLGAAGTELVARGGAWLGKRRVSDPEERPAALATLVLHRPPSGQYAALELSAAAIAYEDEWVIALHKSAGTYVGATPWDLAGNMHAALGRYLAARDGCAPPLHLAHQLDRDTSGLLLVSKSPKANGPLAAAFAGQRVAKSYLALCAGSPPAQGELRTGHGRSAGGRWRVYRLDEVGRELPSGGGRVKVAHTSYVVENLLCGAALVRAAPHSGRTHQIRLHMANLGCPLLGDSRYGGPATYCGIALSGHLLHAASLRLAHPIHGAPLELASPLPDLFQSMLAIGSLGS